MKIKTSRLLVFISFFLLFSAFLYNYLSINLWDYDFWWHIATGRYIVETGSIPDKDPLSYTSGLEENRNLFPDREHLILKQYWLSQVIFYLIYGTFGATGIIILRSLILFLIIFSVFWGLKRNSVNPYLSFAIVFLVYKTTLTFTGERPVLFTMLFSVTVFLLLDEYLRNRERKDILRPRGKSIFLLIPLMLLWPNLHGGFIIGIIIIAVFLIGETPKIILKKSGYTRQEILIFYAVSVLSIAISAINPNGLAAFMTLSAERDFFHSAIHEYMSTFSLYKENMRPLDIGYLSLLLMSFVVLILRGRQMSISCLMLFSGLLYMSTTALRFMPYYVFIGAIVLGREINLIIEKQSEKAFFSTKRNWLTHVFAVMILLFSSVYFIWMANSKGLSFKEAKGHSVPVGAVDFIEGNRLSGNIYNDFGFGGYITWRLYPWKKTFTDTRSLNSTVVAETVWILEATESMRSRQLSEGKVPLWEKLLNHYEINIILLDTLGVNGTVPPVILSLLEHDKWVPVYADLISIIFVRDTDVNREIIRRFRVPKEMVYNTLISRITQWAMFNKENPRYLLSLGDIFYRMGRINDALTAYEYADKRLPHNNLIKQKIEQTKKEIESTT